MLIIDDSRLPNQVENMEIVKRVGRRRITTAVHDIDGTHSRIREWPPVMSRCLHETIHGGLPRDYDAPENVERISCRVATDELPETDSFCVESAGLSALTQMEWAIRRALQEGRAAIPELEFGENLQRANATIIQRIWQGEETFEVDEPQVLVDFIALHASRLFRFYEQVLKQRSRDRNLQLAQENPERWRVPGALHFMRSLHEMGVQNYFLTGAVVDKNAGGAPSGGIYEEVVTLGFDIGANRLVEGILGSSWNRKTPKGEATLALCKELGIAPRNLLIVGDGRAEIGVGVEHGAVTISRLPGDAERSRQIHRELGTNYIVPDFDSGFLSRLAAPARR